MDAGAGFLLVILLVAFGPVVAAIAWSQRRDWLPSYIRADRAAEAMREALYECRQVQLPTDDPWPL